MDGRSKWRRPWEPHREATEIARKTTLELDDRARADVAPFRELGIESGKMLSGLLTGEEDLDELLKESSLFKFQSEIGTRNIDRSLAVRGLHGSGAGLETLARFNAQLVAEEGQRTYDRLFNLTTLGQTRRRGCLPIRHRPARHWRISL